MSQNSLGVKNSVSSQNLNEHNRDKITQNFFNQNVIIMADGRNQVLQDGINQAAGQGLFPMPS